MAEKTENVKDWFYGKARTAAGIRRNIVRNEDRARDRAPIGRMYFFFYDPKTKDKLPMYDKFPLVLPIERYADGFLGINLHYLDVGTRAGLLGNLRKYASNNNMDETTRLRLSYDLLARSKNAGIIKPGIKRYLYGHVRSKFIEVMADEWDQAIRLGVEIFVSNPKR